MSNNNLWKKAIESEKVSFLQLPERKIPDLHESDKNKKCLSVEDCGILSLWSVERLQAYVNAWNILFNVILT